MGRPRLAGSPTVNLVTGDMTDQTPTEHWEDQYAGELPRWSGRVNPTLADALDGLGLTPGTALDLGCGEGGDAIWLASRGWQVTGVDISPTAVARAKNRASSEGFTERVSWIVADLSEWAPAKSQELVCASFLHSRVDGFPRIEILRRSAGWVSPGGHVVIVSHLFQTVEDIPPWVRRHHAQESGTDAGTLNHLQQMPAPAQEIEQLGLDPKSWMVLVAESKVRDAVGPDGLERARLSDGLIVMRRTR